MTSYSYYQLIVQANNCTCNGSALVWWVTATSRLPEKLGFYLYPWHWKPYCTGPSGKDNSDTMTEINVSEFHVLYFEFCVLYFDFFLLCFGLCVSLVLLFETKCQWIVVRPSSNVTYVTRAIFVVHFFFFFFFFFETKSVCLQYLLYKKGKIKANIVFKILKIYSYMQRKLKTH